MYTRKGIKGSNPFPSASLRDQNFLCVIFQTQKPSFLFHFSQLDANVGRQGAYAQKPLFYWVFTSVFVKFVIVDVMRIIDLKNQNSIEMNTIRATLNGEHFIKNIYVI